VSARLSDHPPGVMFVTDRHATGGRPIDAIVAAAIEGGAAMVQVREKDLGGADLLALAQSIVGLAKQRPRVRIVINDRLDVALAAKAAGVHLPAAGLPVAAVRRHVGDRFLVGRSVHGMAEAREAGKAGADYLICGPVFATPSKAAFGEPLGIVTLRKIAEEARVPVWAIGGITAENAGTLHGIPIAGVAVIGAVAGSPDPAGAVRALRAALGAPDETS
jgi:thiamine-phosphate diphosphorylase